MGQRWGEKGKFNQARINYLLPNDVDKYYVKTGAGLMELPVCFDEYRCHPDELISNTWLSIELAEQDVKIRIREQTHCSLSISFNQ